MNRRLLVASLLLGLPACGDDGGSDPADAGAIDAAARADATPCPADLAPADDGTGLAQDLLISEVAPGDFIELYNNTDAPIALADTSHQLCSPFQYAALSSLAPEVVIAPGGMAAIPFPSSFQDTDAGGEVIMFASADFSDEDEIVDFLCWGTNPHGTRMDQATPTGKWSGACAGALTGGSIHRVASTDGTTETSYDVDSAPSPTDCE